MKYKLLLIVIIFSVSCSAQSPFKPLPRYGFSAYPRVSAVVTPTDSVFGAVRFITNIIAYAEPGNQVEAGAGIGYQKLDYKYATGTYYCDWSISAMMWAGGTTAPTSPTNALAFGIMLGALNNLIMAGPSLNNGHLQATVAVGINLN